MIDRTRPTIEGVTVSGDRIIGVAKEHQRVAFSIDGLFDSGNEKFELVVPADLGPGAHRVIIRARDARGNMVTFALQVGG